MRGFATYILSGYSAGPPTRETEDRKGQKMRIERRYTKEGQSPYADIVFRLTTSEIPDPDGSVVFHADDVEVPEQWSQVASDVLAQKYFRKAGVPARLKKVEEESVPPGYGVIDKSQDIPFFKNQVFFKIVSASSGRLLSRT